MKLSEIKALAERLETMSPKGVAVLAEQTLKLAALVEMQHAALKQISLTRQLATMIEVSGIEID